MPFLTNSVKALKALKRITQLGQKTKNKKNIIRKFSDLRFYKTSIKM